MSKNNKRTITMNCNNRNIEVEVIYRKRKNITIQVKPKDYVAIISPDYVTIDKLQELLTQKREWISKKLDEFKDIDYIDENRELRNGTTVYYLGEEYSLKIIKDEVYSKNKVQIHLKDKDIIVKCDNDNSEYIKSVLKQWYKKESEKIVLERLVKCRESSLTMMQLIPSSLKVKEQKKIWGSCTSKRAIYINSRISMARPTAIDYILIHEFCHLVHLNHSKEFYKLVKSIMPEYKKEAEWLKNYGYKLTL